MQVKQSSKLSGVSYEIRGPVAEHAARLEAEGHHVVKLNTGNPLLFGFEAPSEILQDIVGTLSSSSGYSSSKGLLSARRAVAQYYQNLGIDAVDVEEVFLGNGVSELIMMAMTALLENGDEVLVPAPDFPLWTAVCLTFSGLSKSYRCAGFRGGWLLVSGPTRHAQNYLEGLTMLAGLRLCANVPAQQAIQAALGGRQSIYDLTLPGGRLREQRDRAWEALNAIPGVSCVKPRGAIYAFPKIDLDVYPIHDDEQFVLDLLLQEKMHIVQGTGFNWPRPDHFRILTLPHADDLEAIIERIGRFLATYRQ